MNLRPCVRMQEHSRHEPPHTVAHQVAEVEAAEAVRFQSNRPLPACREIELQDPGGISRKKPAGTIRTAQVCA